MVQGGRRWRLGLRGIMIGIAVLACELAVLRAVLTPVELVFASVVIRPANPPELRRDVEARLAAAVRTVMAAQSPPPDVAGRLGFAITRGDNLTSVFIRLGVVDNAQDHQIVDGIAGALARSFPPTRAVAQVPASNMTYRRWGGELTAVVSGCVALGVLALIATRGDRRDQP